MQPQQQPTASTIDALHRSADAGDLHERAISLQQAAPRARLPGGTERADLRARAHIYLLLQ
jgi:hypothetical protein